MSLRVYSSHPAGAAAGPPVLLVHGFTSDATRDWSGWAEALNAAGRSTYAVDLPAHGASPAPASAADATTSKVAAQLAEVIDSMGTETVDVIGYSLGARLSWELPGASSKPVRRLVLGGISPGDPFTMVDYGQLRAYVTDGTVPTDPMTGTMLQMVSAAGHDAAGLAALMEGLASEPFAPTDENSPRVSTLFVAGEADQMAQGVDQLAGLVPDAKVLRVPGDHVGALTSPEFRAAALEFLTG